MLVGFKHGATVGNDAESKTKCYEVVQKIIAEFKKEYPTIVCRELLSLGNGEFTDPTPEARTAQYYKKRPCVQIVEDAARAVENILFKEM